MVGNQCTLERFLKRKSPPAAADDSPIEALQEEMVMHHSTHHSSRIARHEVKFDELPYDPADRRRISDYIGQTLQDDVR